MPEMTPTSNDGSQQKTDRRLILALALPPLAAGVNTIVGFIVAHWITITANKRAGFFVSAVSLALCAIAAVLAWSGSSSIALDETLPHRGRQVFMAKLALLLAGLCALLVIAGTLALVTLGPSD
jgi:hypothetical protein